MSKTQVQLAVVDSLFAIASLCTWHSSSVGLIRRSIQRHSRAAEIDNAVPVQLLLAEAMFPGAAEPSIADQH